MGEKKTISTICNVLNGFAFKSDKYVSSGTRVIRITNVQKGYVVDDDPKYYPESEMSQLGQYVLRENDLLMSLTGNVGRVGLLTKDLLPAALNQRVACLRIKDSGVLLKYLFYYLNSDLFEKAAIFSASGIAQKNMSTEWLKKVEIPVPSIGEQQRIVDELDLLAGIIDKKNAQLRDLDSLVDSLFYEMFGEAEVNQKGFPLLTVDDVIQFQGGSQPDKKYFEYEPTEDNVRLIQIRDYKTDRYITYVPKELARRFCTEDDIMIGRYGPPIFQILKGISGAYNVALMKAVPKQGNKDFIRVFLKQKRLLHYLESFSRRVAGQDGIQMDKLRAYPFPFPPMELQNRFAKQYHEIEKQKQVVSQSMAECESLLSSRMSRYFD